jgi:Flp pilus assembly protein TadD
MHGRFAESFREAERAIAIDPKYAATYDLIGAAYTKLGQPEKARDAFLTSLRFDAHDSTAYTNLGLLELTAGNHRVAANYFAEALGLDPHSPAARQGLTKAQIGVSN